MLGYYYALSDPDKTVVHGTTIGVTISLLLVVVIVVALLIRRRALKKKIEIVSIFNCSYYFITNLIHNQSIKYNTY